MTRAESKGTYQEIKDYVLEHFGLMMSTLYIAQAGGQQGTAVPQGEDGGD